MILGLLAALLVAPPGGATPPVRAGARVLAPSPGAAVGQADGGVPAPVPPRPEAGKAKLQTTGKATVPGRPPPPPKVGLVVKPAPAAEPAKVAKGEKAEKVFRPTLDRKKGSVGDIFTYTLRIVHDPGERYLVPAEPDFGPFARKGREFFKRTLEGGLIEETFLFRLSIYKTGVHRIPTQEIPFVGLDGKTHRAVAQDIDVTIASLLPAGKGIPPLKGIKPPLSLRVRDWRLLYAGAIVLGLLLLAGLGWLGYRYGQRIAARPRPAPPPPPPRPAHLIAFEKLAQVKLPTNAEELKHFYEQVSGIVREYYGNRYGLLALDMTTAELLEVLRGRQEPGLVVAEVTAFLSEADLVKFAKFSPEAQAPQRHLEEGRRLIEATRERDPRPDQQAEAA